MQEPGDGVMKMGADACALSRQWGVNHSARGEKRGTKASCEKEGQEDQEGHTGQGDPAKSDPQTGRPEARSQAEAGDGDAGPVADADTVTALDAVVRRELVPHPVGAGLDSVACERTPPGVLSVFRAEHDRAQH